MWSEFENELPWLQYTYSFCLMLLTDICESCSVVFKPLVMSSARRSVPEREGKEDRGFEIGSVVCHSVCASQISTYHSKACIIVWLWGWSGLSCLLAAEALPGFGILDRGGKCWEGTSQEGSNSRGSPLFILVQLNFKHLLANQSQESRLNSTCITIRYRANIGGCVAGAYTISSSLFFLLSLPIHPSWKVLTSNHAQDFQHNQHETSHLIFQVRHPILLDFFQTQRSFKSQSNRQGSKATFYSVVLSTKIQDSSWKRCRATAEAIRPSRRVRSRRCYENKYEEESISTNLRRLLGCVSFIHGEFLRFDGLK